MLDANRFTFSAVLVFLVSLYGAQCYYLRPPYPVLPLVGQHAPAPYPYPPFYPNPYKPPVRSGVPPVGRSAPPGRQPIVHFHEGDIVDYEYFYDSFPENLNTGRIVIMVNQTTKRQPPNAGWPSMPSVPSVPSWPSVPARPNVPSIPSVPSWPSVPARPNVPSIPSVPSRPSVPGVPSRPSVPGALRPPSVIISRPPTAKPPVFKPPSFHDITEDSREAGTMNTDPTETVSVELSTDEEITEEVTEEIAEEVTEEVMEEVTEEATQEIIEEITEAITEAIIEEITEELFTVEAATEEAVTEEAVTEEAVTEEAVTEEAVTDEFTEDASSTVEPSDYETYPDYEDSTTPDY